MNKGKKIFGIIGILSVAVLIAAIAVSILGAQNGYSPLNGFVGELGTFSSAQLFNIGLIAAGALLAVFMIGYGIHKNNSVFAFAAFFGILSGVLLAAQGVFSLSFSSVHYIVTTAYFISAFIACALLVIATVITDVTRSSSLVGISFIFVTGILNGAFAGYMITGGMQQVFVEDVSQVSRASVIPFAMVQWIAFAFMFALILVYAIHMITSTQDVNASASKKDDGKVEAGEVRSAEL